MLPDDKAQNLLVLVAEEANQNVKKFDVKSSQLTGHPCLPDITFVCYCMLYFTELFSCYGIAR